MPLLAIAFVDELQSGVPVASAPEVDLELVGGAFVLTGALLSGPALVGYVLETVVVAASDRLPRRPLVAVSLAAMALALAVAAVVPGVAALSLALGAWGTAAGVAEGVAEASLVHGRSDPAGVMTRWALAGALGDLLAPVLLGGALATGLSWRELLLLTSALPALDAVAVALGPALEVDGAESEERWLDAARGLLTDRVLLGWLVAAASCVLLDELLVMLIALRLEGLGASALLRGASLAALASGMAAGLLGAERRLASSGARGVLLAACGLAVVCLPGWLACGASPAGMPALFALGLAIGPMWPLATAAAYARRPDRPGLVAAVDGVVSAPALLAPLVVGAVADRFGLVAALVGLLAQPLLVAAVAAVAGTRRDRSL